MKAVAEPHYLKCVLVRLKDEEDVHNVDGPEVPPDPGSSPQPWMKAVAEPHHLRRVRVRIRLDDEGKVHKVQTPKVSTDPGPLHELGGRQEQHSEAAMLLPNTKIYLDGKKNYLTVKGCTAGTDRLQSDKYQHSIPLQSVSARSP